MTRASMAWLTVGVLAAGLVAGQGCQLPASTLQKSVKNGHIVFVEWYNEDLDPGRVAGMVDLRFRDDAREAWTAWTTSLIYSGQIEAKFMPGNKLVFQDLSGNIVEVRLPRDSMNKLVDLEGEYFTHDPALLEKAMAYLTLPPSNWKPLPTPTATPDPSLAPRPYR